MPLPSKKRLQRVLLCALLAAPGLTFSADAVEPFERAAFATPQTQIDRFVFAGLKARGFEPARPCSDAVFVRRVYLDVLGKLPTADEASAFLDDDARDKRAVLIDNLLERDAFADYRALHWSDALRIKAEFPINLWPNAAQAYHRWVRTAMVENLPYDQFARQLLTGSGSNFRVPQVNFYRAVQSREPAALSRAAALTFMGVRVEAWPEDHQRALAVLFSRVGFKSTKEWKEEIVYFDRTAPAIVSGSVKLPDRASVAVAAERDPREAFADWLITADNPYFARNAANRIWANLLGRGIVHEVDDVRDDNPPSNPKLLDYLAGELVKSGWDAKHLYRLILNSRTYQLSSIPTTQAPAAAALFASYPVRRLEAEVLIDVLNQITGTTEDYSSMIPEPFTFVPKDVSAVSLPDGSITSPFLELFGRPPRDTGLVAERANGISAAQRLHMLNSGQVQQKIERGTLLRDVAKADTPRGRTERLYLTILSRRPTRDEMRVVADYAGKRGLGKSSAAIDLAWALLNSSEFLYRH